MRRNLMSFPFSYVVLFFCLAAIAGCAKEGEDLTTAVVGRYLRGAGPTALQVTVNKVNNNTVVISLLSQDFTSNHGSCTMNSATSITLNEATGINNPKDERYVSTGTATLDGDYLSIMRHEKIITKSTGELKSEFDTTYVVKRR
ncbi:MAG TPA: hypothetical protein VK154_17215 [Chitinophagales bacterium]|nr:hypothetical protein [Chitinophagales bacterium]